MLKKFMMVPLLLALTACSNGSNDGQATASAAGSSGTSMGEELKCKKGPFNNKHELADFLVSKVYGKSQQNALDIAGRPESVSDGASSRGSYQLWHYHGFCSQPDEITGKNITLGFVLKINQDGMVDVEDAPLSDISSMDVL